MGLVVIAPSGRLGGSHKLRICFSYSLGFGLSLNDSHHGKEHGLESKFELFLSSNLLFLLFRSASFQFFYSFI